MKNLDNIIEGLRADAKAFQPDISRVNRELNTLKAAVASIHRKIAWLECWYRYGDIIKVQPRGPKDKVRRYVVIRPDTTGRRIKKDGTLYAQESHMYGAWSFRGGTPDNCRIEGRYEGDDLPAPNAAAQFGLDNR